MHIYIYTYSILYNAYRLRQSEAGDRVRVLAPEGAAYSSIEQLVALIVGEL